MKNPFAPLMNALKPMTWPQRFEHIWYYYKGTILLIALAIFGIVTYSISLANRPDNLLCGVTVNASMDEQGTALLQEDLLVYLDAPQDRASTVYAVQFSNDEELFMADYQYSYNQVMRPVLMATAQELDYLVMDGPAMNRYLGQELYMDLRKVFTQQELEQLGSRVYRFVLTDDNGEPVTGEAVPMVLEITDLPIVSEHISAEGPVYLAFTDNAPNADRLHALWDYLTSLS